MNNGESHSSKAHQLMVGCARASGTALIFAVNFWLVIVSARTNGGMAAIWSANAVLVFLCIGKPLRSCIPYYVGAGVASLACNYLAGFAAKEVFSFSVANIFEAAFAVWALSKMPTVEGASLTRNLLFLLGIALTASAMSASIALSGMTEMTLFAWQSWFLSDALGLLLVVPCFVIVSDSVRNHRDGGRLPPVAMPNKVAAYLLVLLTSVAVFAYREPALLCIIAVPVLIAVLQAGRLGAVISTVIVAAIAVCAGYLGFGPFIATSESSLEYTLLLQTFLACQLLITLPVSTVLQERQQEMASALERERLLRDSAERALRMAERANRLKAIASARDELTGLNVRSRIIQKMERIVERAEARGEMLSVAIFDIDHFKSVNDKLGHLGGDEVLRVVGEVTRSIMPRRFKVGRIGGEEFLIIMPGQPKEIAIGYVEHLRLAIMADTQKKGPCRVTISTGLKEWHRGDSVKSLLSAADLALYEAKAKGRNCLMQAA